MNPSGRTRALDVSCGRHLVRSASGLREGRLRRPAATIWLGCVAFGLTMRPSTAGSSMSASGSVVARHVEFRGHLLASEPPDQPATNRVSRSAREVPRIHAAGRPQSVRQRVVSFAMSLVRLELHLDVGGTASPNHLTALSTAARPSRPKLRHQASMVPPHASRIIERVEADHLDPAGLAGGNDRPRARRAPSSRCTRRRCRCPRVPAACSGTR